MPNTIQGDEAIKARERAARATSAVVNLSNIVQEPTIVSPSGANKKKAAGLAKEEVESQMTPQEYEDMIIKRRARESLISGENLLVSEDDESAPATSMSRASTADSSVAARSTRSSRSNVGGSQTQGVGLEYVLDPSENNEDDDDLDKKTKVGAVPSTGMASKQLETAIKAKTAGYIDDDAPPMPPMERNSLQPRPGATRVSMDNITMAAEDNATTENWTVNPGSEDGPVEAAPPAHEIDAELVDPEADRARLKEELKEVLQTQSAVQVVDMEAEDRLKRARQRRNLCVYMIVAVVLAVVVVVAVVVSVNNANEEDPTESPTMAPTVAPTSRESGVELAVRAEFGDYPEDSPQALAVQWLIDQDIDTPLPGEDEEDEESQYTFYERYVAAVLAYSTQYENWVDNTNWMDPELSICEWKGLTCNDDGRIGVLDLAVKNLQGPLPSEIGYLNNLDFVFLFRNSLTGTIPTEIGQLDDVDFMYLNENQFTGPVPDELAGLIDADDLFLFGNQLTGTIPASFGGLADLVNLYLHDNQLQGTIPPELQQLKRLQRLYLQENNLEGRIPSELGGIISLQRLQLQQNELTGAIPPELGSFLSLSVLTVNGNQLTGVMPDEVCALRNRGPVDRLDVLEADCQVNGTIECSCCSSCF